MRLSYFNNGSGAEVLEENNFYPFGLKHEGYNDHYGNPSYNYQYNGKEYQTETGWSDYGARMYMPDMARWGVIDPLAEASRRFTPYNYALNNPIMFIDPDGRKAESPDQAEANIFKLNAPEESLWWAYAKGGPVSASSGDGIGDFFVQMGYSKSGGGGANVDPPGSRGNFWKKVESFFSNLFGGKKKENYNKKGPSRTGVSSTVIVGAVTFDGYATGAAASETVGTFAAGSALTRVLTLGGILLPTMIGEPEFNWTRNFDIPTDVPIATTGEPQDPGNLYLYRNMRSVNGMPMVGEGLDKLGLRDRDVNLLANSSMITPLFSNGLSVTVGYGNNIPSDVRDTGKKSILFRIPASSLLSYGLVGVPVSNPAIPNYGQIRPAIPMNVGTFRKLIQSTAPAWQPVK